jgi:3-hydroxy-3-methylglutaryl CoA synthase
MTIKSLSKNIWKATMSKKDFSLDTFDALAIPVPVSKSSKQAAHAPTTTKKEAVTKPGAIVENLTFAAKERKDTISLYMKVGMIERLKNAAKAKGVCKSELLEGILVQVL